MKLQFHHHHYKHKKTKKIMASLQEIQDAIAALQLSVDAKQAAIAAAILALQEQIAAGGTPAQLQQIVNDLQAVQADVESTPTA